MFHTLVLSQIFGLYLVIMAIILLSRARYYQDLINNMSADRPSMLFGSTFGLMLGLFLVCIHNNWSWSSDVIITVLAWLILIKSILWLSFPKSMLHYGKELYGGAGYYIVVIISAFLGVILLAKGFHLFL